MGRHQQTRVTPCVPEHLAEADTPTQVAPFGKAKAPLSGHVPVEPHKKVAGLVTAPSLRRRGDLEAVRMSTRGVEYSSVSASGPAVSAAGTTEGSGSGNSADKSCRERRSSVA